MLEILKVTQKTSTKRIPKQCTSTRKEKIPEKKALIPEGRDGEKTQANANRNLNKCVLKTTI